MRLNHPLFTSTLLISKDNPEAIKRQVMSRSEWKPWGMCVGDKCKPGTLIVQDFSAKDEFQKRQILDEMGAHYMVTSPAVNLQDAEDFSPARYNEYLTEDLGNLFRWMREGVEKLN